VGGGRGRERRPNFFLGMMIGGRKLETEEIRKMRFIVCT
jgi:hypothetical protein